MMVTKDIEDRDRQAKEDEKADAQRRQRVAANGTIARLHEAGENAGAQQNREPDQSEENEADGGREGDELNGRASSACLRTGRP